jgi:hypothetical protein
MQLTTTLPSNDLPLGNKTAVEIFQKQNAAEALSVLKGSS